MVHGAKYSFDEIKDAQLPVCFDCLRGRVKAFPRIVPRLPEDTKVYKNLEKIAVDDKGKFPVKSVHGNDSFYLIVDQASKLVHCSERAGQGKNPDVHLQRGANQVLGVCCEDRMLSDQSLPTSKSDLT